VKSSALSAVIPTSIKIAASKTITIKGVSWSCRREEQLCRQALTALFISDLRFGHTLQEETKQAHLLTQISCIHCTGTGFFTFLVGDLDEIAI